MTADATITIALAAARTATASVGTPEAARMEESARAAEDVLRAEVAGLESRAEAAEALAADRLAMLRAVVEALPCGTCGDRSTWVSRDGWVTACDACHECEQPRATPVAFDDAPLIRRAVKEARRT